MAVFSFMPQRYDLFPNPVSFIRSFLKFTNHVFHTLLRLSLNNDNTEGKKSYDYHVVLKSVKDNTIIGGEKFVIELPQEEQ